MTFLELVVLINEVKKSGVFDVKSEVLRRLNSAENLKLSEERRTELAGMAVRLIAC